MSNTTPTLRTLCGKIASGKPTLAAELSSTSGTVLISEDTWLGAPFASQMSTGADYLCYSSRLQKVMAPHVSALLGADVSVVLDFAANTVAQRRWMREIIQHSGVAPTESLKQICVSALFLIPSQKALDRNIETHSQC